MRLRLIVLTLMLVTLSGCAQLREKWAALTTVDEPQTTLLRAPADWGDLANMAATRIGERTAKVKDLSTRAIFVTDPVLPTPFARSLKQFLQSRLNEQGLIVSQKRGDGVLTLDAEVQSIRMASGLQIVVTTSLGNGNRFVFRSTDAYKVNQADLRLYDESLLPPPPPPPPPPVQPPLPTPVKRMNLIGTP
ncbi:hypothetical protein [Chitinimonas sp. BJB300]|uniref:hypothetical protein n=1 Tax=Chitinimonas sp. BJB300 TaxID=1559339 RepID=UPI000C0CF5A2|nr:hypothetical protein [Chitinimonas sp. BJB300]PHV13285.1 hypothetical protein CSQ89_01195 [Chitinimonas sp. BJB300]TSJ86010.1 hypothetical protein FG002_016725 [Chitinimonas sp. BJB300]